jgi:LysM repeat protein
MQGCHKEEPTTAAQPTNAVPVFEPPTNAVAEMPPASTPTTAATSSPPPVVDATAASNLGATEYIVANGDSFYTIAKHFKIPTKALTDANPGVDPLKLKPGQKLHVPAPVAATPSPSASGTVAAATLAGATNGDNVYTVKSGDNLTTIAAHLGTTVRALRASNSLKTDSIKVGQKLIVPPKTGAAPPTADPAAGSPPPAR